MKAALRGIAVRANWMAWGVVAGLALCRVIDWHLSGLEEEDLEGRMAPMGVVAPGALWSIGSSDLSWVPEAQALALAREHAESCGHAVHVFPADSVRHEEDDECVCGPSTEFVPNGSVVRHHVLGQVG